MKRRDVAAERRLISYRHKDDKKNAVRYRQYADDPIPAWAADVQPAEEEEVLDEDVSYDEDDDQ